jgi:hypothetical protein
VFKSKWIPLSDSLGIHSSHIYIKMESGWKKLVTIGKDGVPAKHDVSSTKEDVTLFNRAVEQSEWFKTTIPKEVRQAIELFPHDKFYTDKKTGTTLRRVYGIMQLTDGTCRLRTVTALWNFVNDTVNGCAQEDLVAQDTWTDEQLALLHAKLGKHSDLMHMFVHPMGWLRCRRETKIDD